jgi:hypothetical protein
MLDALEAYGGLGSSKQEIVLFILRWWLRENKHRLTADIRSKDAPFGPETETQ